MATISFTPSGQNQCYDILCLTTRNCKLYHYMSCSFFCVVFISSMSSQEDLWLVGPSKILNKQQLQEASLKMGSFCLAWPTRWTEDSYVWALLIAKTVYLKGTSLLLWNSFTAHTLVLHVHITQFETSMQPPCVTSPGQISSSNFQDC